MFDLGRAVLHGAFAAAILGLAVYAIMRHNPRLILNPGDVPRDVLEAVPAKTAQEKRDAALLGIPFFVVEFAIVFGSTWTLKQGSAGATSFTALFANAFVIAMVANLFDLVILDWWLFCTVKPSWMVIPGTQGLAG